MRTVARRTLITFGAQNPKAKVALDRWMITAHRAAWRDMNEVSAAMATAKIINGERARFEIAGGDLRLITAFDFRRQIVFVKFLGTHAEYDRVEAATVAQF